MMERPHGPLGACDIVAVLSRSCWDAKQRFDGRLYCLRGEVESINQPSV